MRQPQKNCLILHWDRYWDKGHALSRSIGCTEIPVGYVDYDTRCNNSLEKLTGESGNIDPLKGLKAKLNRGFEML